MSTKDNILIYDKLAPEYDAWYTENVALFQAEVEAIRRLMPAGGTSLEVGAGSGRFSLALGVDVAVEPSPSMRKLALARGIDVRDSVAESLPFNDATFSTVLFLTVLEFVFDPDAALSEARRVLQPGGTLIVAYLNENSPEGERLSSSRADDDFYAGAAFFSPTTLKMLFDRHGFTEQKTVQVVSDCCRFYVKDGSGEGLYTVTSAIR